MTRREMQLERVRLRRTFMDKFPRTWSHAMSTPDSPLRREIGRLLDEFVSQALHVKAVERALMDATLHRPWVVKESEGNTFEDDQTVGKTVASVGKGRNGEPVVGENDND